MTNTHAHLRHITPTIKLSYNGTLNTIVYTIKTRISGFKCADKDSLLELCLAREVMAKTLSSITFVSDRIKEKEKYRIKNFSKNVYDNLADIYQV
jgi:hypothetical protein